MGAGASVQSETSEQAADGAKVLEKGAKTVDLVGENLASEADSEISNAADAAGEVTSAAAESVGEIDATILSKEVEDLLSSLDAESKSVVAEMISKGGEVMTPEEMDTALSSVSQSLTETASTGSTLFLIVGSGM